MFFNKSFKLLMLKFMFLVIDYIYTQDVEHNKDKYISLRAELFSKINEMEK